MTTVPSPGAAAAFATKERLEPLGWKCTARMEHGDITFLATRGDEILAIAWSATSGNVISQTYSLWGKTDSRAIRHVSSVGHELNRLTDAELIQRIAGAKVTWWNSLGGFSADAIIDPTRIQIEHSFNERGIELPLDRIVKFIDKHKGAFSAIRVVAITKIG